LDEWPSPWRCPSSARRSARPWLRTVSAKDTALSDRAKSEQWPLRSWKWLVGFWRRHGIVRLTVRRLGAMVVLAFGISLVAFVLTHAVPSDPVRANLGARAAANPVIRQAYMQRYGLDKPLPVQYVIYMENLFHGNLGISQTTGQAVTKDLAETVPASVELGVVTVILSTLVGLPLGLLAAVRRGTFLDSGIKVIALAGIAAPSFWVGLIGIFVFSFVLHIAPGSGRLDPGILAPPHITGMYTLDALLAGDFGTFLDALHHLILPAAVVSLALFGVLQRFTRAAVLEVLENDYVTAARAKGLPARRVLVRYAFRAALTPVLTLAGIEFATLMAGDVLVETVFAFPGVGRYAAIVATNLDIAAITGVSILVALIYLVTNFLVDVLYAVIDPRVRLAE
jgi:peptide/nickel transport system permease protein